MIMEQKRTVEDLRWEKTEFYPPSHSQKQQYLNSNNSGSLKKGAKWKTPIDSSENPVHSP